MIGGYIKRKCPLGGGHDIVGGGGVSLLLKHFVEAECAEPNDSAPSANHENESARSEFSVHFLALHVFVRVTDFHLLDALAAALFCGASLAPGVGDG